MSLLVICGGPSCREQAIDSTGLLSRVELLSSDDYAGRGVDTDAGRRAGARVQEWFGAIGLDPIGGESYAHPFQFVTGAGDTLRGINVLGLVNGRTQADKYIVLSAHYDHLGTRAGVVYNGADDNASGTSAIIAIAETLVRERPRHSVIVAAFDGEESGLRGARAFVEQPPVPIESIVLNINLDMVSRSAAGELYASGTYHHPEHRAVLERLPTRPGAKLLFGHDRPEQGKDDWTNSSDHGPFHGAGIPFVYFGVEDHPGYHSPEDDFAEITPGFYVAATQLIAEAVRRLDEHY